MAARLGFRAALVAWRRGNRTHESLLASGSFERSGHG